LFHLQWSTFLSFMDISVDSSSPLISSKKHLRKKRCSKRRLSSKKYVRKIGGPSKYLLPLKFKKNNSNNDL
jgi:hypothetical protein